MLLLKKATKKKKRNKMNSIVVQPEAQCLLVVLLAPQNVRNTDKKSEKKKLRFISFIVCSIIMFRVLVRT